MSGIKDLHSLLFWLDNTKQSTMEKTLSNSRKLPREKSQILQDLEEARKMFLNNNKPAKFVNKPPNQ